MSDLRINGEPVVAVESFDELRSGVIVYVAPCLCGRLHRGMLTSSNREPSINIQGYVRSDGMPSWAIVPTPPCAVALNLSACISAGMAWRGRLYRVVDPDITQVTRTRVTRATEPVR